MRSPVELDVTRESWLVERADAVLCCNVLQAAPGAAIAGLMRGAAQVLPLGGRLVLCGQFLCGSDPEPVLEYDCKLRTHDPAWGVRNLEEVLSAARTAGMHLESTHELPAAHLALVLGAG